MIPEYFAVVTIVLSFYGGMHYTIATLKGKTKPNKVSWGMLWLFTAIVLWAQINSGVGWPLVSAATALFNVTTLLLASFVNPKAYWKAENRDYIFIALALVGLLLWKTTDDPNLAIAFSIIADFSAAFPIFIKAYKKPETENGKSFVIWSISHFFTLLIIQEWSFVNYAFPVYLIVFNSLLAYLIVFRTKLAVDDMAAD